LSDKRSSARDELLVWTMAQAYWDRAIEYLELARVASDPDVQLRYMAIARHYRTLAQAEERNAERMGIKRRSGSRGSN
jgi:hypothetical protein